MTSTEWETPQAFFDTLNEEFHFTLDACASDDNAKCLCYFTAHHDGLDRDWSNDTIWMNPPYDRTVGKWVAKVYREAQKGSTVVVLIQARSADTQMWHDYVMRASEWRLVKGRLQFLKDGKPGTGSNISSIVVVFRPGCTGPPLVRSIDTEGLILR